ncbi:MAG: hypothetical protein U0R26_10640 [Solirubrobacterales bacterium]
MSPVIGFAKQAWRDPSRRNLLLTVGAGLTVQFMLVITGPFLARLLGPAGRGDLAALMLWPVVLVQLGCLGIPSALTYYVSSGAPWRATIRRAMGFAGWQLGLLTAAQAAIALTVFADRDAEVRQAAVIRIAAVAGLLAQEYGQAILQARSDMRAFNVLRLLPISLFAAAVIVLFVLSASLVAVVVSWVAAVVLIGGVTLAFALTRRAAPVSDHTKGLPADRALLSYGLAAS